MKWFKGNAWWLLIIVVAYFVFLHPGSKVTGGMG